MKRDRIRKQFQDGPKHDKIRHMFTLFAAELVDALPVNNNMSAIIGHLETAHQAAQRILMDSKDEEDPMPEDVIKNIPHGTTYSPGSQEYSTAVPKDDEGVDDIDPTPQWVKDAELRWQGEKGTSTQV